MNAAPVQLAIVGHTNTGKTSLLRTLGRDLHFGEVSNRPATTRDVAGIRLLAEGEALAECYDTPGLEDAIGLAESLAASSAKHPDPVARIEAFLRGDHEQGRYEQEAKVLRQLLRSDAALYIVDAREPVLAKHREELRLLAECGRPLMPVLNFVADAEADVAGWRTQLARLGLHVLAEYDTVVYDAAAERRLFEKLGTLLEARRDSLMRLLRARERERQALIEAAARAIAELLVHAAGARETCIADAELPAAQDRLRTRVRDAEQACIDTLLALFQFDLAAYQPPALPLDSGHWQLDLFDPETLRVLGIRASGGAAAGGMAGLAVDAVTGGLSLGAAALIGAGLGAAWSTAGRFVRPMLGRLRGQHRLALETTTLAVLAHRQTQLLQALLRRGHAAQTPLKAKAGDGWPSPELRDAVQRARSHPEWSALNVEFETGSAEAAIRAAAKALRATLK